MNTCRFVKCVLCMYTGLLISREGSCLPGQTINIFLNNSQTVHLMKDHGFDFKGRGHLYFQINSCMYGTISISDSSLTLPNMVSFVYDKHFFMDSPRVSIGYRCFGCTSAENLKHILACGEYRDHWIQWADGIFALGEGQDVNNQSTTVVKTTQDPISVDEISLTTTSVGHTAFFRILKDNAPSFKFPNPDGSSQVKTVEKRPVNSTVLSVRANDPENDPLTFSVEGNDSTTFHFDGENLKISSILKRDSRDVYRITISVTDGKNIRAVNVTLFVVPLLTSGDRFTITEEPPLGSMVDSLYKIHDDRTDINYSLQGTDSDFFSINKTTGKISIAKRLDREALSRHYLDDIKVVVTTSDGEATASLSINITVIDINDNIPKCVPSTLYVEVHENANAGEQLLNISCTDGDPGVNGLITLEVLEPTVLKSLINVSTTTIFIQGNALDLETMATDPYIVTIKVSDSPLNTDPLETIFYFQLKVLGVNEHDPIFTYPALNNGRFDDIFVYENVSVGSMIWSVNATDADYGVDGQLTSFLDSVISDKDVNHMVDFTINNRGELMTTRMLDRDSPVNGVFYYNVTIGVRDNGNPAKTSLATLHIDVIDNNDNIPTFKKDTYELSITCNASIGFQLTILEVNDLDSTSEVTIAAMENTDGFLNVSHDGKVTLLKRPSNAETNRERFLRILATDGKWSVQGYLVYNFEACSEASTSSPVRDAQETTEVTARNEATPSLTGTEAKTSTPSTTTSNRVIEILEDVGLKALCIVESVALIVIVVVYIYKKCMISRVVPLT